MKNTPLDFLGRGFLRGVYLSEPNYSLELSIIQLELNVVRCYDAAAKEHAESPDLALIAELAGHRRHLVSDFVDELKLAELLPKIDSSADLKLKVSGEPLALLRKSLEALEEKHLNFYFELLNNKKAPEKLAKFITEKLVPLAEQNIFRLRS